MFIRLAYKSLLNRKGSVWLTLIAMTVSVFVLMAVEHIRQQAKVNFANTVSGVDLIVGARSGSLNLLLYSVFRVGAPTNNIAWQSYTEIAANPEVAWAIPFSLGDSHRGYRVLGTTTEYFEHFSYGQQRALQFAAGGRFESTLDLVLGAEVARQLDYELGQALVLAHGIANTSFSLHTDHPFKVVGILAPTGTPVDHTLHVSLAGIEAIHQNWQPGQQSNASTSPIEPTSPSELNALDLQPTQITAFMLGLKSRISTFKLQRAINEYSAEPLLAILPGVALAELWQMLGVVENTLRLISALVVIAALLGLSAMLVASIRERHQEVQLLQVLGAPPRFLFFLIQLEALLISVFSICLGALLLYLCQVLLQSSLAMNYGLQIPPQIFTHSSLYLAISILMATLMAALLPAAQLYHSAKNHSL